MARIILPKNPDDVIVLLESIIKKEEEIGPGEGYLTPEELNKLKDYYTIAKDARLQQMILYTSAEEKTKIYENALGTNTKVDQPGNAKYIYTGLRDVLIGKNKSNLKMLGKWGFDVVDEVAQKKVKKG